VGSVCTKPAPVRPVPDPALQMSQITTKLKRKLKRCPHDPPAEVLSVPLEEKGVDRPVTRSSSSLKMMTMTCSREILFLLWSLAHSRLLRATGRNLRFRPLFYCLNREGSSQGFPLPSPLSSHSPLTTSQYWTPRPPSSLRPRLSPRSSRAQCSGSRPVARGV